MTGFKFRVLGACAASAMMFTSTATFAASIPAAPTQPSPWAALSVMSGGAAAMQACGATAAAGAAATAAQPTPGCVLPQVDVVPVAQAPAAPVVEPVPVVAAPVAAGGVLGLSPIFLGLAALAAGIGLYFATRSNNGTSNSPF